MVASLEMFLGVAGSTEQFPFFHRGGPEVCPMVQVMDVAIAGFGPASGSLAVAVPGDDCPSLCGGPDSGFAADIQDL